MPPNIDKIHGVSPLPAEKGVFSGLDFHKMINDALKKKEAPIKQAEKSVLFNNEKVAALSQMQSLINSFSASLSNLKGLTLSETGTDLLKAKKVVLSSTNAEKPENFMRVTPGYNFKNENFTLEVTQLAQNRIMQTAGFTGITSSITNPVGDHSNINLFTPGTFSINGQNITVTLDDTVQSIVNKINSKTTSSNVSAQIINPASNDYRIVLQSSVIGVDSIITLTDPDNVLNNVLSAPNALVQEGQNAIVKYNDTITINKPSNTITDFAEDLTIDLYNPTSSGNPLQPFKIKVAVVEDLDKAMSGIEDFVDQYNQLVKFVTQQQGRDNNGNYYPTAKIQREDYITNLLSDIRSVAAELAYTNDSKLKFGIKYIQDTKANPQTNEPPYQGLLSLDKDALRSALQNNFSSIVKHFRFDISGDLSQLNIYKRGEGIRSGNIALDIDVGRTSGDVVRVTYNSSTVNMTFRPYDTFDFTKGGRLIGQAGTVMEGYEFGYNGNGIELKNLTINQGVADKIFERIREISSTTSGSGRTIIEGSIVNLLQDNIGKQIQIDTQIKQLERERDSLLTRYSQVEAKIAQYQSMMDFLDAQNDALNKR
jgi:flagellar hook-associated protein 2